MQNFLKFFSTAPFLMTLWLSITSIFIIFVNFISPDNLIFPSFN